MKYNSEEKRLDNGLCPICETELVKAEHLNGPIGDDHAVCPKCKWEDVLGPSIPGTFG